jgi:hypothetical protein
MRLFIVLIHDFFQPEELSWRMTDLAGPRRPTPRTRRRALSLKAVFWCAVAILLSLGLGHLT